MNTEITDNKQFNGWILYDDRCGFCVAVTNRFRKVLARRHYELMPLQTPWVRAALGVAEADLLSEMRLLKPDGKACGGADALLEIGRQFWWAWPIRQISRVPFMTRMFHAGYRWFACQRRCFGGTCRVGLSAGVGARLRIFDLLPLFVFPLLALAFRSHVAPWIFMWMMAFALYCGCKWLTIRIAIQNGATAGFWRKVGYLLAWPGMDGTEFLDTKKIPAKPRWMEWWLATAKIGFGAVLLWGTAPVAAQNIPWLAGWLGMTGAIFILHFGAFHLLSLAWRRAGVQAAPLMRNPLRSKSLAEFWGARWNTAFNELSFRFAFQPLRRWTTQGVALMIVFGLSGLIHELVISLPANGGYVLPTLYFQAQGLGILLERSRCGQALGLGRGVPGWCFTLLITAGPAFWLFHPPFIHNVILPMLTAIGAT